MFAKALQPITVGLLLIGLVGLAGCRKSKVDTSAKAEAILAQFAGGWVVVSLDRSGKSSTAEAMRDITVTVDKDKFTMVEIKGPDRGTGGLSVRSVHTDEYAIQLDPGTPQGEINFAYASGDRLGQTRHGIYVFDGNTLRLCLAEPGTPRPTAFNPGENVTLLILERKP